MTEQPETLPAETEEKAPLITPARPKPEENAPADTAPDTELNEANPVGDETAEQTETAPEQPAEGDAKAEETPAPRKGRAAGLLLDTLLVLMLGGALGGGGYYLHRELNRYRVPSPMELAAQENLELCKQREALQEPAYHADEQLHMRKRLAALVRRSEELKRSISEKKQVIETQHQKVLAVQHDIRQEDKSARSVAKGLLPGMAIGTASTTSGKTYNHAVIRRIEGGRITLRIPEGQATFPVNTLVKDNLPDFVRYAFGLDDMVDMSDFEATADTPAPKPRKGKLIPTRTKSEEEAPASPAADYEPAAGAPVVDTEANKTTRWTEEGEDSPDTAAPSGSWQPPAGALPFGAE